MTCVCGDSHVNTMGPDRMVLEMSRAQDQPQLERGMGPLGAISANVLNMVGVGPFLTIPLAISAMGGPQAIVG